MEEALPIPVHDLKDVSTVAAIIEQSALFQTLADLLDARDACICFLLPAHGTYDAAAVLCAAIAVLVDHRFFGGCHCPCHWEDWYSGCNPSQGGTSAALGVYHQRCTACGRGVTVRDLRM